MDSYGFQVSSTDPMVTVDIVDLTQRIANACKTNGITSDAQWATFVATRFNNTNASGMTAGTQSFLVEFFTRLVKIG